MARQSDRGVGKAGPEAAREEGAQAGPRSEQSATSNTEPTGDNRDPQHPPARESNATPRDTHSKPTTANPPGQEGSRPGRWRQHTVEAPQQDKPQREPAHAGGATADQQLPWGQAAAGGQEAEHPASTEAAAAADPTEGGGGEVPPLEESCPADDKCGRADRPYHEGQGDQRRGNKHTKSEIRAEFRRQGVDKPPHLTWNQAAHMVGMTPFAEDQPQEGGTPPQPASSSGEPPPDSKAAAEAKARHERDKAKFATLLNLHHLPRDPPAATPHQGASSSGEPAPGSKESSEAERRHEARMEALQAQTGQTPAAASHSQPTQPQADSRTDEATSQQHPTAVHIPTGGPVPVPFPLDSPVTWSTPANYYLASMGGTSPPTQCRHRYPFPNTPTRISGTLRIGDGPFVCSPELRPPPQATSESSAEASRESGSRGDTLGGGRCSPWELKERCILFAWQRRGDLCGTCSCGHTLVNANRGQRPSGQATTDYNGMGPRSSQASPG